MTDNNKLILLDVPLVLQNLKEGAEPDVFGGAVELINRILEDFSKFHYESGDGREPWLGVLFKTAGQIKLPNAEGGDHIQAYMEFFGQKVGRSNFSVHVSSREEMGLDAVHSQEETDARTRDHFETNAGKTIVVTGDEQLAGLAKANGMNALTVDADDPDYEALYKALRAFLFEGWKKDPKLAPEAVLG